MSHKLKRINQSSLRDQVIDAIRDAIVHGEFKPGEKIHEHALAQQLGVSRTPIREAFGILEQQGLIHIVPKRGTFVARVGRDEMRDKLSIRVVIEQLALKQAMERLISKQWVEFCKKLEQILIEMKEAVEKGELATAIELDMKWHTTLVDSAKNLHLSRTWRVVGLQDLVWSPEHNIYPLSQDMWTEMIYLRHMELLDILRKKDFDECYHAIELHIMRKFIDIDKYSKGDQDDGKVGIADE